IEGKLAPGQEGRLKIESEGTAQPVEVDLAKVKFFNEPPTEWHGFLEAAGRATDGNTHTKGFVVALEGVRATEVDQFTLRAIFHYLSVEAGLAYTDNNFYDSDDEAHLGARVAGHVRITLPLGLEVVDDVTLYPNFKESQDWQAHNEAALTTSVGKGWSLRVGVISDYDRIPPPGLKRH